MDTIKENMKSLISETSFLNDINDDTIKDETIKDCRIEDALKEKLDMYEKPPRKSRKTFATDTFKMLNNRMLYYRKVLGSTPCYIIGKC